MANTLIIGKDLPDCIDFAEGLTLSGRTVFCAAKDDADASNFESENIFSAKWNKSSAISAHSLLIQAETKLSDINEVIFYFDADYFCSKFELDKTEDVSPAVDSMVNSYLYMANELLSRADVRQEKLTVSFLIKEYPSKLEVVTNGAKMPGIHPASNIVSYAQAGFENFAQNFAANINDRQYLSVILAKCSLPNELYKNEKGLASWIAESFDVIAGQKNRETLKQAANWNKAGAKISSGLALLFK